MASPCVLLQYHTGIHIASTTQDVCCFVHLKLLPKLDTALAAPTPEERLG
jgi:hypothetical protein